ncbi:polysaccharide biosynthesis protein [Halomonas sp. MCCC 1A17488]|uniref:Polysaccharide biosynthesis protein n=1 Tax=Billgrantia sulfidoxydans TaxID=2733484 RepID=A0ABX7W309_9GAMM|nr:MULTISPECIES: nucleoside-diphosphate sugar epimerase/dehydratase [Halomonas]MCE8017075.1 polysaccharide biosynthesis protein [Halomonas sp. MCCC 1A17488]MCG3240408.1 polysaccharide biosynthesis protein [Halomonas sp. MCCC 1A17488]QPP49728.1 polysaccharide biosynthesis protein [Halomonas sp. SS10-MC5]QTP53339.1 polysaccharide biosynthesis protein [Halomonas sulfidoxydans]
MQIPLQPLLMLPRSVKRRVLVLVDATLVVASLMLACALHWESLAPLVDPGLWQTSIVVALVSLVLFHWLGLYRVVIRYMSHTTVATVGMAVLLSSLVAKAASQWLGVVLALPVVLIYGLLLLLGLGGVRFLLRELYLLSQRLKRRPVVIYGAGAAGCELVAALRHGSEYEPVAFVDDWRGLDGALVEGLRVYQPVRLAALVEEYRAAMVLLAIPSAPRCRRREILQRLSALSVPVKTIPGSADVIAGRARISELRDVALEDLLGREPVPPFPDLLAANIEGKTVMVTGAGGSIGSELCRQIIAQRPVAVLLVDSCEYALYAIEHELSQHPAVGDEGIRVRPFLVSVQQPDALRAIFTAFPVDTVYHAAAYKHVPLVECNLVEGLRNNVFGTLTLARAALAAGVESFVLISTDKAVRPTNVMGASKRLTELICQAFAQQQSRTCFSMVRFGNVLGSSGSVVPLFRQQIERGGPVAVTHPDITRYFMTIPEAAQLVIQAGAMATGGEVFVLDMGEPVRIRDLAINMIRLSGLEVKDEAHPDGDIEIVYTGLRPGEKLFEELLIGGEVKETRHHRIMTSREMFWEWPRLEAYLQELQQALTAIDYPRLRQLLLVAPLDYCPEGGATPRWEEVMRAVS